MSSSYIPYQPEQQQLLPSALQDWLPQGHLAFFISDTVDSLDLSDFHARYAAGGPRNQPFHPVMIVKVLVYAYATGTFSSRKIARKLFEDVAFRVLAADNFPAHRTIRDFRALHLAEFTELFTQVVRLAREMGLVKLGTIAVDGTQERPRVPPVQHARSAPSASGVEARLHGAESAADGDDADLLTACSSPSRHLAGLAVRSSRPLPAATQSADSPNGAVSSVLPPSTSHRHVCRPDS